MLKARFCQNTSLYRIGNETVLQAPLTRPPVPLPPIPWPTGQRMFDGRDARNSAVCPALESPAGCGSDSGTQGMLAPWASRGQGVGALAWVAKKAPKSVPEDAVESFDTIVLLIRFTAKESCNDTPPPSQPATLLVTMLFVNATENQRSGLSGKVDTSIPLTPWKRTPPPLPASAALPMMRLALITRLGPMPSPTVPKAWLQSASGSPGQVGSVSGALMTSRPPPLLGVVGLVAWLNRIVLCWMLPFQTNPIWETPAPSPVLKFPHTQLKLNW